MAEKAKDSANEDLLKKANDTPSVQGAPSTSPDRGNVLKDLDKDSDSNRSKTAEAEKKAAGEENKPRLVGSPIAPKPTKGKYSDVSKDGDTGEEKPMPHLDNTDVEDAQAKVSKLGKTPKGMRKGANASVPETEKTNDRGDSLDLAGMRKALVTARNKVVDANKNGVKLTQEEFEEHSEVVQLADEVRHLLGNMR